MELKEYASLLQPLLPLGVNYITMDYLYIKAFIDKPQVSSKTSSRHLLWHGAKCVARIKYWRDFLDISSNLDENGDVDWTLLIETSTAKKWTEKVDIEKYVKLLDFVLPFNTSFVTINNEKIGLWRGSSCPQFKNGKFSEGGGHIPHSIFSAPKNLIEAPDVACYKFTEGGSEKVF